MKAKNNSIPKSFTPFTKKANKAQYHLLNRDTISSAVGQPEYQPNGNCIIKDTAGDKTVWSQQDFSFLEDSYSQAYTVNPSLWNNGHNNHLNGVFRVGESLPVFQVRGYDMANISFVYTGKKDNRWLIFDTLMSGECTLAAVQLFNDYLVMKKPLGFVHGIDKGTIAAIIVSHSHIDHYGGLQVLNNINAIGINYSDEQNTDVREMQKVTVYAPEGFAHHAVSENLYAGVAMGRRASYQYGTRLPGCTCGRISIGIGQGQSTGTVGYMAPTQEVDSTFIGSLPHIDDKGRHYLSIGNIHLYFQLTPGTEAPAEMNNYLEFYDEESGELKANALWMAENCNGTLHNLYTLRGAQVRDAKAWADYLMETMKLWPEAEAVFQAHNWPHTGREEVKEYLFRTAAAYKMLNDQCLLYMNQGYKPDEIAEKFHFPKALARTGFLRPYYGTPRHNARAVYQRYLGWYDANPAHLDPLAEEERSMKYLEFIQGNGENLPESLRAEYENGNYRLVADMCNLIIRGEAGKEAETDQSYYLLFADALEQLGYMAESGIWRNCYLTGAKELREGYSQTPSVTAPDTPLQLPQSSMMRNMSNSMLLDYLGIVLDTDKASALDDSMVWASLPSTEMILKITDGKGSEYFHLFARYGVLLYLQMDEEEVVGSNHLATAVLTRENLYALIANIGYNKHIRTILDDCGSGEAYELLQHLFGYMVNISLYSGFDIVTPRQAKVRRMVKECAGMLGHYYETFKKNGSPCSLSEADASLWAKYQEKLVETGVLDGLYFFSEIPDEEYEALDTRNKLYKYQYSAMLYECYKYLAGSYIPHKDTQFIKFCIDLTEPYLNRFRRKQKESPDGRGAGFHPFDNDGDMDTWKTYCLPVFQQDKGEINAVYKENIAFCKVDAHSKSNAGIGPNGQFYGSELVHFLYLCYKFLYEHKYKGGNL